MAEIIRTFYWNSRSLRRPRRTRWGRASRTWRVGNAGDLFNRDLLGHLYARSHKIEEQSPRILLVGSVAHRIGSGDVVCGIGSKGVPLPPAVGGGAVVIAARGPRTLEALKNSGHDVSNIRFLYDPGLFISRLLAPNQKAIVAETGRSIFIPHYRDQHQLRVRGIKFVDIDSSPIELAERILRAEIVYSSSLHGVIFAHSLGRPCIPILPSSDEPRIKYQDYFESIGLAWHPAESLDEGVRRSKPLSPIDQSWDSAFNLFPTFDELKAWNVVESNGD